jgi:myo-inositol-1(or 4)-monophosphatase
MACGRLEAFWEPESLGQVAGRLLAEEAGGRVTDMHGRPHSLRAPHLLVSNGHVHEQMIGIFGEVFAGKARIPMPAIETER